MQHDQLSHEIERFLNLTDRLETLLIQEMDLLHEKNEFFLEDVQRQKERLTREYAQQMGVLKKFADYIKTMDPDLKTRLIERTRSLQETSELNERILKAALDEKQSVILMLLDLVRQQQKKLNAYGGSGTFIATNKVYAERAMPISMDRRL